MPDKPFRARKESGILALFLLVAAGAILLYWRTSTDQDAGDYEVRKGNYRLEDRQYDEAIREFMLALQESPRHLRAHHGLAVTYLQMGKLDEALVKFNVTLEIDPAFVLGYADRGITHDRMGLHEEALRDYRKALELDPKLLEGPGWLWRFLHNVSEKPPTIAERAAYLEEELKKPSGERRLINPEIDGAQRMYKK